MLEYLLKSSASLVIFIVFYKIFLENESIHVFKRMYLLTVLLISFGIPFITFTQTVETLTDFQEMVIQSSLFVSIDTQQETTNYLYYILWSIYFSGVFVYSLKFLVNLTKLSFKIKQNPKLKKQKSVHILLNEMIVPHTFLNYIFLNKVQYQKQQIPKEVLIHEEVHATQKHTLDILFIEVIQIFLWFNPLIYILKKSIKLNHEFLADQEVIKKGITLSKYQQMLLAFSSNDLEPQLATAINYSSIKKRFTVMKTVSSKTGIWLRSLVFLPLLAFLIYSFSAKKIIQKETESYSKIAIETSQEPIATINGIPCEGCKVNLTKDAIEQLILGTNTGEAITSFKIKFIGKPTVSVSGNKLNKKAIALLNENEFDKMIQIFNIKTTNSHIKMPILIELVGKDYKNYSHSPIVKKGEKSDIPPPPALPKAPEMQMAHDMPPPPPPKSPLDFVIDMAKKGATFYFEGKKVTSDKAINVLKQNKSMNISAKDSSSKNPKIYLSKEPITIND